MPVTRLEITSATPFAGGQIGGLTALAAVSAAIIAVIKFLGG